MNNSSDYYCRQAESDESVLHVLHHNGEDDQAGVEYGEDGPVYVSTLKTGKNTTIRRASCFCAIFTVASIQHRQKPDKMSLLLRFSNLFWLPLQTRALASPPRRSSQFLWRDKSPSFNHWNHAECLWNVTVWRIISVRNSCHFLHVEVELQADGYIQRDTRLLKARKSAAEIITYQG